MALSPNTEIVLNYLKRVYPNPVTKYQMAEDLGPVLKDVTSPLQSITGVVNGLEKKGFCSHTEQIVEETPATETRKAKTKVVMYHVLTEEGLAFDPVAEEEAKALKAAEEKAAKKAAREAAKAEKAAASK